MQNSYRMTTIESLGAGLLFIDCHAHIVHPFNYTSITKEDVEAIVKTARANEVNYIVSVSSNPSYYSFYDIEKHFESLVRVVGIQRGLAQSNHSLLLSDLKKELKLSRPKAIGEVGLDYTNLNQESGIDEAIRKQQQKLFRKQIQLAQEFDLPIVIHSAEADIDLIDILEQHHAEDIGGMVHGCSCGTEARKKLIDMGFFLSFGPNQLERDGTFEMVRQTPIEKILTETDAPAWIKFPDTSVEFQPADVSDVARKLAKIKEMELEELARAVLNNAKSLFNL